MSAAERFERLPTGAKLFLILTAALLPIGIALVFFGQNEIRDANAALQGRNEDQASAVARSLESLIARNALAVRIAANGALAQGPGGACDRGHKSLTIAPAVAQNFELETVDGKPICATAQIGDTGSLPLVAPGDIRLRIAPTGDAIAIRAGVANGMATALITLDELKGAIDDRSSAIHSIVLHDDSREVGLFSSPLGVEQQMRSTEWPLGHGALKARIGIAEQRITALDRLLILLPVLMWVAAAIIVWLLVSRLLIRPLRRLQRAVQGYEPGDAMDLPHKVGPSTEIQDLRDAFVRAFSRAEQSEREVSGALEGQRRLVREVHHRVKNNLQVIASLLNIHGRSAGTPEAQAAYAGISRRVGALSIVHRNHFAEMEENRGISMRPLLSELAAELRAGAPESARGLAIDLDLDTVHTTQDVAVAIAFLVTEIVEFAMLHCPADPIEVSLRRTSELTGRLSIGSRILNPNEADEPGKVQFERIVGGLAKQLRSTLDRKLGRYSVDLPVFPPV